MKFPQVGLVLFHQGGKAAERLVVMKKAKKKVAKTVDMTVKDFQTAIGLDKDPVGYVATAAILRMLVRKGVAKEVARLHLGNGVGRKTVVYQLPLQLTIKTKATAVEAA